MLWVSQLDECAWTALAGACGATSDELRPACIFAAHISFHFFWRRVLEPAADLPWRLARGDVAANLHALREGPKPEEPFAQQLWMLMRLNFPRRRLIALVELLGDVGWTTLLAEQQHVSLSVISRLHPEYTKDT